MLNTLREVNLSFTKLFGFKMTFVKIFAILSSLLLTLCSANFCNNGTAKISRIYRIADVIYITESHQFDKIWKYDTNTHKLSDKYYLINELFESNTSE